MVCGGEMGSRIQEVHGVCEGGSRIQGAQMCEGGGWVGSAAGIQELQGGRQDPVGVDRDYEHGRYNPLEDHADCVCMWL